MSVSEFSPIQKCLRTNFILSFLHSQGEFYLQHRIHDYVADFYMARDGDAILDALSNDAGNDEQIPAFLEFKILPKSHVHQGEEEMTEEVREEARLFLAAFRSRSRLMTVTTQDSLAISEMHDLVIDRDVAYQNRKMPRYMGNDPHASFFRRYVVLGQPAGTEAMDALYDALDAHQPTEQDTMRVSHLRTMWEQNHPGELFYPVTATA